MSEPGLLEHFEEYLGSVQEGWSTDPDGVRMPFQIVRFDGGPHPGTVTFATLGLSSHPLPSSSSAKQIRQELLMVVPESLTAGPVPSLLHQVAMNALAQQSALLRGDVLGPQGPILPESSMEAFYVGMPVYFPDDFSTCEEQGRTIVIAWLIPISRTEADFVFNHGWSAFEDQLVDHDPDLTDPLRPSLQL